MTTTTTAVGGQRPERLLLACLQGHVSRDSFPLRSHFSSPFPRRSPFFPFRPELYLRAAFTLYEQSVNRNMGEGKNVPERTEHKQGRSGIIWPQLHLFPSTAFPFLSRPFTFPRLRECTPQGSSLRSLLFARLLRVAAHASHACRVTIMGRAA